MKKEIEGSSGLLNKFLDFHDRNLNLKRNTTFSKGLCYTNAYTNTHMEDKQCEVHNQKQLSLPIMLIPITATPVTRAGEALSPTSKNAETIRVFNLAIPSLSLLTLAKLVGFPSKTIA